MEECFVLSDQVDQSLFLRWPMGGALSFSVCVIRKPWLVYCRLEPS